jgi:hypothetical protein
MVLPLGTGFSADAPGSPLSPFGPLGSWPARKSLASSEPSLTLREVTAFPDLRPGDGVPLDLAEVTALFLSCRVPTLFLGRVAAYAVPVRAMHRATKPMWCRRR